MQHDAVMAHAALLQPPAEGRRSARGGLARCRGQPPIRRSIEVLRRLPDSNWPADWPHDLGAGRWIWQRPFRCKAAMPNWPGADLPKGLWLALAGQPPTTPCCWICMPPIPWDGVAPWMPDQSSARAALSIRSRSLHRAGRAASGAWLELRLPTSCWPRELSPSMWCWARRGLEQTAWAHHAVASAALHALAALRALLRQRGSRTPGRRAAASGPGRPSQPASARTGRGVCHELNCSR